MEKPRAEDKVCGSILEKVVSIDKDFAEILPELEDQETQLEGSFTWQIDNWFALREPRYVSPRVEIGGLEWNLLLFPNGNHNKGVALYLAPHPKKVRNEATGEMEVVDPDWYCCAQFVVVLSRPGEDSVVHTINRSFHRFNGNETDWGFANIIDVNHLKYPARGRPQPMLNEGKLNITTYIRILKDPTGVLWHNFINYDSKKVTGYVGFKNQGATCYLNSLLQSYFFTKYFRKLVYEIPTERESPNNSVPMALQRAFYQLQVSNEPLDTLELTRSFGWDSGDAFTQHDVQELNRILMDRLENRMKGTSVEGKLNEMFVGKMKSYIKCIDVEYESSRVEEFWDLQLNVKGLKGLPDSFENYIEIELMNGENQYAAQNFGLQDAEKGVIFESFPPVLHLQLKRFEYDFNYDQLIKINDRYEFPESLDISPYLDKESAQFKDKKSHIYNLHGVLVHAGDISTGHYYTMIRPNVKDEWYRFDDEKVWKVTKKQAFDENFGVERLSDNQIRNLTRDEYQEYMLARHTSAYMLVYIRKDKEAELLQPVTDDAVPHHIIERVEKENKEREQREKEIKEAHLYVTIRVHTIENFIHYEGFETIPNELFKYTYEGLNDSKEQPLSLKVKRTTKVKDLYSDIKKHVGIPLKRDVRYWRILMRQNNTLRVSEPILPTTDDITLEESFEQDEEEGIPSFDIFVEEPYLDLGFLLKLKTGKKLIITTLNDNIITELRTNLENYVEPQYSPRLQDSETHSLVFLKIFDLKSQRLHGLGYTLISPLDSVDKLNLQLMLLLELEKISTLYEEINVGSVVTIQKDIRFFSAEIGTGDIIAFEVPTKEVVVPRNNTIFKSITEYYYYLEHRVRLRFNRAVDSTEEYVSADTPSKSVDLWVSAYIKYEELAELVSTYLNTDPAYLKLFAIYSNGRYALKSTCVLNDYLLKDFNCNAIPPFEYEILSIPLTEFEHLRPVKFYWLKNSYIHFQCFEFEVPNTCSIEQFLDKIQEKIGFSDEEKEQTLLWTNNNFKFESVLSNETLFKQIPKASLLFGRILPEEKSLYDQLTRIKNLEDTASNDISMTPESEHENSISPSPIVCDEKLVVVTQYFKDLENRHGISFLFKLIPEETFPQTRDRLHEKFGLGQKEFLKIRLSVLIMNGSRASLKPLSVYTPDELKRIILFNKMRNWDSILMDHPDRLRSHSNGDRPMFIKN